MRSQGGRPVLTGLAALVLGSVLVGALAGLGALLATRALGLSDGQDATDRVTTEPSMSIPGLEPTPPAGQAPSGERGEATGGGREEGASKPVAPTPPIRLAASPRTVSSFQQIYLTGTYARGGGAILQVERREGGAWRGFPVTVTVNEGGFRTYVQTSQPGRNFFRMRDSDSDAVSNVVIVTVR